MKNIGIRYFVLGAVLIAAWLSGSFFNLSSVSELPDPTIEYTFPEFTDAKVALIAFDGPYDEASIDTLIEWLGHGDNETSETVRRKIVEVSAANEGTRNLVNSMLISRLYDRCMKRVPEYADQRELIDLRMAANILADQKVAEALDMLIECSTVRDDIAGLSFGHNATFSAVLKYDETAVPSLLTKYETARPELKDTISMLIYKIDGPKVIDNLKYLRGRETDPKIWKTITRLIESKRHLQ